MLTFRNNFVTVNMDNTQFLVQWDEHPSHLATRLGYLLEHQSLVDVTLMCNTHTLKVHRAVLAACSPYFERQLGNHPLIVLKDMKFSVLKSLVEFMYCGETSVSEENLSPLLEAAKFFEVKGLSSMTKETVCAPSTSHSKTFNGTAMATTSSYGRGGGRGRGRGRGRPPLNTSTKVGSPTESAQILLSLSGTQSPIFSSTKSIKLDPTAQNSTDKLSSKLTFEPRRRGRKRGALNTAFRDRLLREADTQLAIENLKRDLSDENDMNSPLLSSLLNKQESKTDTKYLKDMGLSSNVPIVVDNGQGKLLTLTEDVLKSVMEGDNNIQLHLPSDSKLKKPPPRPFIVKEMQATRSDEEVEIKREQEGAFDEEMLQSLKNGAVSEAENEPEAVVLFEVTDNKKVEKYVLSAKEVSLLKALNEQLTKQKKELADITNNSLSTVDITGSNTKVAELKLKIGKTKSILSQVVGYAKEKLKNIFPDQNNKKSQMVQLEFIDGNGEKIEGYQVTGTLVDKKENKDEFLGLFDMVCDGNNDSPLLSGDADSADKGKLTQPNTFQLEDNSEAISYEIEAMMNDSSNNIVIEDKNPDFKYIIDNDGNIMNQEDNYVVYESENVIYDGSQGVLPDITESAGPGDYVVSDSQVIHEDGTEYIVYDDKEELEIKGMGDSAYIVYENDKDADSFVIYPSSTDMSKERESECEDVTLEGKGRDDIAEGSICDVESGRSGTESRGSGAIDEEECKELHSPSLSSLIKSNSKEEESESGDVPMAVGLVPLKEALEKFQTINEHQPRKTRLNSICTEENGSKRKMSVSSDTSDRSEKRMRLDPTLIEGINEGSL
ncbi:uncharacterized protein LOC106674150 isoform X2 [Cimex lectularius]|uniref:BTB domain-containing protein n=1 Tax=Cimex lectularius TaxID=79782 RepID=A0A8I6SRK2_CIMLE|nr:uncharacterized protein LOC106674150 isoform X2 [Cimex lectularius]